MVNFSISPFFQFSPEALPATPAELSEELKRFFEANVRVHSAAPETSPARHFLVTARASSLADRPVIGFMYFYEDLTANLWEMWGVAVEAKWRLNHVATELVQSALTAASLMGADQFVFRWTDRREEHGKKMAPAIDRFLADRFHQASVSHDGGISWQRPSEVLGTSPRKPSGPHWAVALDQTAPYPVVFLKRPGGDRSDYQVVEVNLERLLALHDRDHMRIPNADQWPEAQRRGLQHFLDPKDSNPAEMPIVGLWDAPKPGWWARLRQHHWPAVVFTNGRHRARLLAHFGAKTMPVEVSSHYAARLIELCAAP